MAVITQYSARFELPDLIERDRANTLQCRVYRDGALVAPSSGTFALYDGSGNVVTTGAVTVAASVATYSISSGSLSSYEYSEDWYLTWALVMPDTNTHEFRNDAMLVKVRLYCPITEADLYRRVSSLDPSGNAAISTNADFSDKIDEAWVVIQNRLIERGNRPYLIMSPSSLREVTINLTLAMIFEDLASRLNEAYVERAQQYRAQFDKAWASITWKEATESGVPEDNTKRRSQPGVVWLTSGGRSWRR